MTYHQAHERLTTLLRDRIYNGGATERGLARVTGLSQPHIHNVLKGAKVLSPESFDVVLRVFNLSLLHLFTTAELTKHLSSQSAHLARNVPFLSHKLRSHGTWPLTTVEHDTFPLPMPPHFVETLVMARIEADPEMGCTLNGGDIAALDISMGARVPPLLDNPYILTCGDRLLIRHVRATEHKLYVLSDRTLNEPMKWTALPIPSAGTAATLKARLIWVGKESERFEMPDQRGRFLESIAS